MSQDKSKFQSLSLEDVVSVLDIELENQVISTTTFTVDELRKTIPVLFECDTDHPGYKWCDTGMKGRVLMAEKSGGWKTGRIRFSIEFLPDVPERDEDNFSDKIIAGLDEFR
jgi:KGK domain